MNATRKEFLFGLGAASVAPQLLAGADKPLLRVGVTTDTHFGRPDVKGVERVEKAWNLFKRMGCGLIANCGDIADRFYPQWYEEACKLRERVFTDSKTAPREVWVYAGHDRIDMPDDNDKRGVGNYALLKEKLKITHEAYDSFSMAGFEFLVVPQSVDLKRYESMVAKACAKTPKRPVFIFDHEPAARTTENSAIWGSESRLKMLSKYPQVVHVTGHAHGSLYNEQNIHQGAFTSVSAACLTYFGENYTGTFNASGQNRSVLVMELFADYAVIRRFSIDSGDEIGADEPWTIQWPYDPKKPFYSHENMRARHTPPAFASGAALAVETVELSGKSAGSRGTKLKVVVPETGNRFTRHYRLEAYRQDAATGKPVRILQHDLRGEFWKDPKDRQGFVTDTIDAAIFMPGEKIAIRATPCDFWGGEGRPLTWRGVAPVDGCKVVWQGEWMPDKGKYVLPELPPEADGKDVKVVVEAEFDQPGVSPVSIGVKPCDFWWAARVSTPLGHTKRTYVFYITKAVASKRYEFSFQGGCKPWTVKFTNLRLLTI